MASKNVSNQVIRRIMTVPDEEFGDLSVSRLAYSFKISRYKLTRQFKSHTKMTLEDFLFKEKMARAAYLLAAEEGIRVKDVSEMIGFCTCDYFIRKFKAYYGIVPGKYKECKTGVPVQGARGGKNARKKDV